MNERARRNLGVLLFAAIAIAVGLAIGSGAESEGVMAGLGATLAGGGGFVALLALASIAFGLVRGEG